MKISTLVDSLQALQSKHGDVEVVLDIVGDVGGYMQSGVDQIYERQGEIVIEGDETKAT
jgi:hypothetical protein